MTPRLCTALCLFLLFTEGVFAQAPPAPASQAPAQSGGVYPDSPAGLQHFAEDLLSAIKASDNAKADSLWQATILPDHAAWFAAAFGEKEATRLARGHFRTALSLNPPPTLKADCEKLLSKLPPGDGE